MEKKKNDSNKNRGFHFPLDLWTFCLEGILVQVMCSSVP